jgi:ribosomal protein S18 acetylase RimI-like enzyme
MSGTTETIFANSANSANNQNQGLEIDVREYEDDNVYSAAPGNPGNHDNLHLDDGSSSEEEEDGPALLVRSMSGAVHPMKKSVATAAPAMEAIPETATTDSNIKRVDFKDEATTARILTFLETRGINTNKLVQEHMLKYGSRARFAVNDDGNIVGFALFDNEVVQAMLNGASDTEIERFMETKPFIFFQLLIVDDPYQAGTAERNKMWSKRLIDSVTACIVKNGKIGIVRVDADNEAEIELYRSCGFYTMEDMGVPSYSTTKDKVAVLGYTPLGLEQTAEIFKKFYSRGARF